MGTPNITHLLLAGHGRAGTTAFMQLLASDPAIQFERAFPFEHRELSYFAKLYVVLQRRGAITGFGQESLIDFDSSSFGPLPWAEAPFPWPPLPLLDALWRPFLQAKYNAPNQPERLFYAEKCAPWLPALVRQILDCRTIYMLRDPRDLFLSADAFTRAKQTYGFGKTAGGSDVDFARNLCFSFVLYFENYWMDRHRADSILFRYENFVLDPGSCASLLNTRFGTCVSAAETRLWNDHVTSPTLAESVRRFASEPLPDLVEEYLQVHLADEIQALGYADGWHSLRAPARAFRFCNGAAPLEQSADGSLTLYEDHADVAIRGGDFWIAMPFPGLDAQEAAEAWVSIQGDSGEHCSVYWRGEGEAFAEERSLHLPFHPGAHWQVLRFRLRQHPLWRGRMQELRLDILNGTRRFTGAGQIRWFRLMA